MPTPQAFPHVADLANPTRSGDPDMPTPSPKSPHAPHALQFVKHQQPRPAPRPGRRIRRCGRAAAHPVWRALLLAGAVAAMLGMPAVAQAAATPARATPAHATPAHATLPASAVTTPAIQVPAHPAAPSGGICKVP